jgi:APA family basic amino acid/polyamine antiporter
LKRRIGLFGATAMLVGYIVGASIFILPGELAAVAGPAVIVSYLLAAVPAFLCCVVSAEIGSTFPVSGATYVAVSRVISPFWGFITAWAALAAVFVGVPLVAYGLADYLSLLLPSLESDGLVRTVIALGAVLFTWAVNARGVRLSVAAQTVMVVGFLAVLVLFGVGGVMAMEPTRLSPFFPVGVSPVVLAAVPAYFSFIGFFAIVEMAEEIERPAWTIPRALLIGFGCVLLVYGTVAVALPGLIDWQDLATTPAPLGSAAATFLPGPAATLVSVGALLAIITSLNAIFLAQSRDIYALACDGILPDGLARLAPGSETPNRAVGVVAVIAVLGVLLGASITRYATLAVVAIMVVQILASIAFLRLGKVTEAPPEGFRLGSVSRGIVGTALIVCSLGLTVLALLGSPAASLAFLALIAAGAGYYELRRRTLRRRGVDIEDALRKLS